jgi:hypothetical protein
MAKKKVIFEEGEVIASNFSSVLSINTVYNEEEKTFTCKGSLEQYLVKLDGSKFKKFLELKVTDKTETDTVGKVVQQLYSFADTEDGWEEIEPELLDK